VIILGDSGVGKTSLMNQYVRDIHHPTASSTRSIPLTTYLRLAGQQEIQCQLQGDNWSRFSDKGGSGGRPTGDDAGRFPDRPTGKGNVIANNVSNRSGILQVKNGFNHSVLRFIGEPTAAFWFTM